MNMSTKYPPGIDEDAYRKARQRADNAAYTVNFSRNDDSTQLEHYLAEAALLSTLERRRDFLKTAEPTEQEKARAMLKKCLSGASPSTGRK